LKVNQTIRVMLPADPKPLALPGKVVWARLEAPTGLRPKTYRAGVQFTKRDDDAVAAFIARHGAA
jgi:Tfp pilus assembly protein PilZ